MPDASLSQWISTTSPGLIGILVFATLLIAALLGGLIRRRTAKRRVIEESDETNQQGYIVSGMLGLLALLMAFTFGIAMDRFETRRKLVITEANAIGTSYLRAQLLDEPHRSRLSRLLVAYVDNRIALASAPTMPRLATNDRLLTQIWAAVVASEPSASVHGMVVPMMQTFNQMIDLDTERKVARQTQIPAQVLLVLYMYMATTAAMLGYVLEGRKRNVEAVILFLLLTVSITLIVDLNGPLLGTIREAQKPMTMLRASLAAQPPSVFDSYKQPYAPKGLPARP
jgi:hypothetical protein